MASRTAVQRPADEERFREFRARRLEKKEADRLKLTAEFPLLFNNKTVGNKVLNSSLNLNSKTPITPSGKRKSVIKSGTNDENNAFAANKSASKPALGAKTPLSSKIPRKGSVLGLKSPIAQQKKASSVGVVASVLPTVTVKSKTTSEVVEEATGKVTEEGVQPVEATQELHFPETIVPDEVATEVAAAETHSAPVGTTAAVSESPVMMESVQSETETVPQDIPEPTAVVRKALFEDEELEQFTSTRSSLSSLGESIAGELFQSIDTLDQAQGSVSDSNGVQEQVLDVLDYLLELEEVDEVTHRRMSSQAFSIKSLKRLSMVLPPSAPKALATSEAEVEDIADSTASSPEGQPEEAEDAAANEEDDNLQNRRCSDVPMDLAYPEAQEDCVIGELDVLNALRNYLAVVNREAEKKTTAALEAVVEEAAVEETPVVEVIEPATAEQPAAETEDTILEFEESSEETAVITATSARSSASSVTTFDPRPQWTSTGRSSNGSTDSTDRQQDSQRSSMASSRSSLDSCCTTTMRVSFANAGAVSLSQKRKSIEMSAAPTEAPSESNSAATAPATAATTVHAPAAKKSVTTHPLADLLDDALMRGLVVPTLTERIEMGNHTKYIVQTQILSVPGYPEENSRVRMMGMKRYADFKSLRAALLETMEAKRRAEAKASTPGKRTSMEGDDILSLARSRRSSVESCYRESLLNPRDSLGTDAVLLGQLGGFSRSGRESELLPPLPSRQMMSMTCASLQQEEDFQSTREAFLRTWIETVFAKQSSESEEYRLELRKFLSA